jgi:hypothetical protein
LKSERTVSGSAPNSQLIYVNSLSAYPTSKKGQTTWRARRQQVPNFQGSPVTVLPEDKIPNTSLRERAYAAAPTRDGTLVDFFLCGRRNGSTPEGRSSATEPAPFLDAGKKEIKTQAPSAN